jgi:Uma2 family endonuclease
VSSAPHLSYTFDDYVRFEKDAGNKHEFVGGLILAMAGGTIEHGAVCAAVLRLLGEQLRGRRCRVYDSNARVRVAATGNAYYPDASVVCGALETDPADQLSILNPTVLVEVLSPTTATYDTTDKLQDYFHIPTLQHVVHVYHDVRRVTVHTRDGDSFTAASFGRGGVAALTLVSCALAVDEIYFDPLLPS